MKVEIFNPNNRKWEKKDIPEIKSMEEERKIIKELGDSAMDYQSSLIDIVNTMAGMKNKTITIKPVPNSISNIF